MGKTTFFAEPGRQVAVITCSFDAPRATVFKTFTNPDLIPLWWGPRILKTTVDRMDVRPGGIWRYNQFDPDGNEYAFHGVYHDVAPPERLVQTFEFEGMPGHVLLETVTFEERNGGTMLTDISVFQTVEDRDGMIASGMKEGGIETMDRLAELLAPPRKGETP